MVDPDWDKFSKLGMLQAVIDPNDCRGFKNQLIDHIHWISLQKFLIESKRLLDFGCGTGRFAARIRNLQIEYIGIDSSSGMIIGGEKDT